MTAPKPAARELTAEEITTERARLGIPDPAEDDGQALRSWLRYQLQRTKNPENGGKPYTQADIARLSYTSETSVSLVFKGRRLEGRKGEKIRITTSGVLGIPLEVLFKKGGENGTEP